MTQEGKKVTELRAIETKYAGCRFRSRLEARWAVFFDALGIEWQYEPQGFETSEGRYLPDFFLPSVAPLLPWLPCPTPPGEAIGPQQPLWLEIKGAMPVAEEVKRPLRFAQDIWERTGQRYAILVGDVPRNQTMIIGHTWSQEFGIFVPCRLFWDYWVLDLLPPALEAARSARFEHGETPVLPARRSANSIARSLALATGNTVKVERVEKCVRDMGYAS